MNIYTEFEKELLERIGNIESRLESIERMLGEESNTTICQDEETEEDRVARDLGITVEQLIRNRLGFI